MINLIKTEIINSSQEKSVENIIITGGSPMYMRLLIDGLKNKTNQEPKAKDSEKTEDIGTFCKDNLKNQKEIQIEKYILYKDRQTLYSNANARFDSMVQKGAMEEVACYLKKAQSAIAELKEINSIETLTSYKTLGVREIEKYLKGDITFEEMSSLVKQKTRNYIKHQDTWFRNKFKDFTLI